MSSLSRIPASWPEMARRPSGVTATAKTPFEWPLIAAMSQAPLSLSACDSELAIRGRILARLSGGGRQR